MTEPERTVVRALIDRARRAQVEAPEQRRREEAALLRQERKLRADERYQRQLIKRGLGRGVRIAFLRALLADPQPPKTRCVYCGIYCEAAACAEHRDLLWLDPVTLDLREV